MVQKHYVITVGAQPGVYFAEWVEVGPLVKNYPNSIWQCAETKEKALRLFENAWLKGHVRDLSLPPVSNAAPRPPTASVRGSSHSSAPSTPHRRHPSTTKLTASRSEAAVGNGVSSTRSNLRCSNPGPTAGRATTSLNRVITLSKAHSEPTPLISASSFLKKVYEQGHSASDGTEASPCVGATNTRLRTRAESPSWLAPYPGDETSQSITPDLSALASPAISSKSFESMKPLRLPTPNSHFNGEAVERMDDDSSELAKSPVPSFRRQEVRGGGSPGIDRAIESKNTPSRRPPKNSPHSEVAPQRPEDFEPFVQLVVDEVLRRLRTSVRIEDESSSDRSSERSSGSKRLDKNTKNRSRKSGVLFPCSPSQRSGSSPDSGAKELLSPGVPNGSVLFGRCHDDSGTLIRNNPLTQKGLCSQCKGTGYEVKVDTSVLDETGLHQPNGGLFHTYDADQDPRSPLPKNLLSPLTLTSRRPLAIVRSKCSAKTSF